MLTCCYWHTVAPQGLFERHKLIVATQLCMAVLRSKGELQRTKFEFLLRGPKEMGVDNPLGDWVSTAPDVVYQCCYACAVNACGPTEDQGHVAWDVCRSLGAGR
jgi:hypothetical protein